MRITRVLHVLSQKLKLTTAGFDVDGVLRDTGWLAYNNCCEAIRILGGKPPSFEAFLHDWGGTLVDYYRTCGVIKSDEEIRTVNRQFVLAHNAVPPFADVEPTLKFLQSLDIQLFALSSHGTGELEQWFKDHQLHVHFEHIRGDGKDKVAHLQHIAELMGAKPQETCYLGDWGQDMRAATAAHMIPIGVTRGHPTSKVLKHNGAQIIIRDLSELADLIY